MAEAAIRSHWRWSFTAYYYDAVDVGAEARELATLYGCRIFRVSWRSEMGYRYAIVENERGRV